MAALRNDRRPSTGRGLTLRTKLGLIYTGVFVLGGALLLGVNYGIVSASLEDRGVEFASTVQGVGSTEEMSDTALRPAPTTPLEPVTGPTETQEGETRPAAVAVLVDDYRSGVLSDLVVNSVLVLAAVTALAGLAGWLIAGGPMRRLHRVTETARTLSDRDLHSRLNLPGPDDEFRELGDTFDGMLTRLERAFDSQRRFVANASHELRTPLALQRAALEIPLAQSRVPEDLMPAFTRMLDSVTRSEALISGLLLLARSDRGLESTEEVDLAEVAAGVVSDRRADAEEAEVELETDLEADVVDGDRVLLEHLVRNLVENAIRYNHAGGRVSVRLRSTDTRTVLKVSNTGGGVVDDPDVLFEPFHRGDAARLHADRPGSGLGLSIVRSIANAHGATATAHARPEGGLVVTVGFDR
ncbi:HAMP domain-containing sensor histidine kinase [Nocardiopsis sp. MG754419]|uniref:sensor histidine kinase n=1 Tax=Nocardiopsis sp. MG754419 TaxID=2259865 RepID=UPI001BACB9AC|nr:ATP-binding protein [Nocardiopsis sp. MG754419]MBR8741111.1 two-component sensor histidine kinase [Nocardiopsis sp. MG754419]